MTTFVLSDHDSCNATFKKNLCTSGSSTKCNGYVFYPALRNFHIFYSQGATYANCNK